LEGKQPARKAYLVLKLKAGFLVLKLKILDYLGKAANKFNKHQTHSKQLISLDLED
jgi:hypothetical protein